MNLLLDSHVLLWWLANDPRLSSEAIQAISNSENGIFVSVASLWEMSIKHAAGKLPEYAVLGSSAEAIVQQQGFWVMPIVYKHAYAAANLPTHHRDPFDRLLIATAQTEAMTLISVDEVFGEYEVKVLW